LIQSVKQTPEIRNTNVPSLIKILPDHVIDKIAAGEVVERPASVVKELIENAIDAGATDISINIEKAGCRLIGVADNGSGMSQEDAQTSFLRHATSKIESEADLDAVRTMGFRGEALSSIASVSRVRLLTAERGAGSGVLIELEGGALRSVSEAAAPQGTSIEVADLFYNTPARLKFLKSPATEFSHILTTVSRQAMAYPMIRFKLRHNAQQVLDLPPAASAKDRTFQLYGGDLAQNLVPFAGGRGNIHIHGLIGRPVYSRADRSHQDFFINHRAVKSATLSHALYAAYGEMLMRDRHPAGFIFIELDPALVDVNVHPSKAEVRFRNQALLHDLVRDVAREGLRSHGLPVLAGEPKAEGAREGIKEAMAGYLRTAAAGPSAGGFDIKPNFLYGRRKTDMGSKGATQASGPEEKESASEPPRQIPAIAESGLVPLAQLHDTFIIAQSNDGLALIDQHAAHERILFEKLQDQFGGGAPSIQDLLIPDTVELGLNQGRLLTELLPELGRIGLIVDDFGGGTFIIKAAPALLVGADYKRLLLDIIDEVSAHGGSDRTERKRDEILSVMACHPAVKAHRRLSRPEMDALLDDLFKCRMPHTCPHGRPVIIRFSMREINKMFKRE
jgi:DNA mismatch repair protein MutL